jgi:glycosyltransferase involved in cell wall biosynthesis
MDKINSLYAAFDTFPAQKGAAIHIKHMTDVLYERSDKGCLYVIGGAELPCIQQEGHVQIIRFEQKIENLLDRVVAFSQQLSKELTKQPELSLVHFRDPWSGFPILQHNQNLAKPFKTVYEVNGFPSIELPYAFPQVASKTLAKIYEQEQLCLTHCDHIITPSALTKNEIIKRGIPEDKVSVIRNGADLPNTVKRPEDAPDKYIIYFGAIQQWQGIDELFRAFRLLEDFTDLRLVMCVAKHNRIAKQYIKMAKKLDIADRIDWHFSLTQEELQPWLSHADISVAPMTDCSRNNQQGCCPLKILESMAAKTPIVASNLSVVRELLEDEVTAKLVKPNRPAELASGIRLLLEHPEQAKLWAETAYLHVEQHLTWQHMAKKLNNVYDNLLVKN